MEKTAKTPVIGSLHIGPYCGNDGKSSNQRHSTFHREPEDKEMDKKGRSRR